jgi:hypothetical protein
VLVWVVSGVALGVVGIAVLGGLTLRLWRQVRALGREVAAASERLASVAQELTPPPRRAGGDTSTGHAST